MYDCIIIGAGPAGMTAAMYAARRKIKTLLLTKELGGQMLLTADIENYSGFTMVSGGELTLKFQEQLTYLKEDLELQVGEEVISVDKNITSFLVETKTGQQYYAKSIILAAGKHPRLLGIPGEKEFWGKGVVTCATCDGPLYKNKDVAVVGGGNSALDALLSLSKIAKRVYSVNVNSELTGEKILKDKVHATPNITFLNNVKAVAIKGTQQVDLLVIEDVAGKQQEIAVRGVFVEIGWVPNTSFETLTRKNTNGEITVDNNLQTSCPGMFAAGDVNDAWGEQIIIAAGEGAKAALAVANYLNTTK